MKIRRVVADFCMRINRRTDRYDDVNSRFL